MPEGERHRARQLLPAVHLEHVVGQQARLEQGAGPPGRRPGRHACQTGRVLDYTDKGDDNRKLCSLYLSIMDRMGVKLDRFGDANSRSPDCETKIFRAELHKLSEPFTVALQRNSAKGQAGEHG